VFIELFSPDGCGSSQELARRVAHRSERVRIASSAEGAVVAHAEIRTLGPGTVEATLTMTEPSGKRWSRLVRSATCEEALDAIALVLAVAFSPELSPVPEPIPEPAPPSPRPRPPESRQPKPSLDDDKRRAPPVASAPPPEPTPPPEPPPPVEPVPPPRPVVDHAVEPRAVPLPDSIFGSAGAAASLLWGPAPTMMPGVSIFGSLRWNRDAAISPAVQLRASHFWMFGYDAPGGVANFALDSVTVSLCPVWLQEHRLSVQLCATGELGRLTVRGTETLNGTTRARPYVVFGAAAAVDIDFGRGIAFTSFANGGAPMMRDSFQFRPAVFYEVPVVVLTAGAGVAVRFL
jgi:hypothetical protein